MSYYLHNQCTKEDVIRDFNLPKDDLKDCHILLACYTYENYSGSAFVLFEKEGKLYEVNGGHCSCNGLEDQWTPEETTWEALKHRYDNGSLGMNYDVDEFRAEIGTLIAGYKFDKTFDSIVNS